MNTIWFGYMKICTQSSESTQTRLFLPITKCKIEILCIKTIKSLLQYFFIESENCENIEDKPVFRVIEVTKLKQYYKFGKTYWRVFKLKS